MLSTVDETATATGLETDAAAYYVQLLALPHPTDKAVGAWTGWSGKRIKELGDELVSAGVAVRALVPTRPVASLFTGAWQRIREGDAPRLEQREG